MYARHRRLPLVYTFHTMWEDYAMNYIPFLNAAASKTIARRLIRFYLNWAKIILAPTDRIARFIAELHVKAPVYLLPTGIPEELFKVDSETLELARRNLFSRFPRLEGKRILMYAGRIVKEKNLDFLLEVLQKVRAAVPETVLLCVGSGPYTEGFAQKAAECHLEDSVFITGYLPRKELVYCYRFADVFVFSSKTETQGLVTAEAMLAGLPVVAIGVLGTVDVMRGDNGGFMVKDDLEEFSAAVLRLLTDEALRKEKQKEALAWGSHWTIASLTDTLLDHYQQCLK
jgi:glycosyltransferase involved in cell wall biosynthesis